MTRHCNYIILPPISVFPYFSANHFTNIQNKYKTTHFIFRKGKFLMDDRVISLRINSKEYEALKRLAAKEVRTASGWLRFRVVEEAIRAGFLPDVETRQENTQKEYERPKDFENSLDKEEV
jgi:hypothetical protein